MKVVSYTRPGLNVWFDEIFQELGKLNNTNHSIKYFSEHKLSGSTWLSKYRTHDKSYFIQREGIDYKGIIKRCRLLRNIEEREAVFEVNQYASIWKMVLDLEKPDFIFSITVDSYIIDLLERIARQKGIPFIGMTGCFINGYFRLSACGEYFKEQTVSASQVARVYEDLLRLDYKPNFLWAKNTQYVFIRRWLIVKIKKMVLMCKQMTDRHNYDYRTVLEECCSDVYKLSNYYTNFDVLSEDNLKKMKFCYIPLHFYPEATVDYWTKSLDLADYGTALNLLISKIEASGTFDLIIVKEHPGAIFTRNRKFYELLKSHPSVKLLSSSIDSNRLLKDAAAVISWTGTVCFQAALQGKPAFLLGDPFFFVEKYMNKYESIDDLVVALQTGNFVTGCKNESDNRDLICYALEGCLPGKCFQKGYLQQENTRQVAASLMKALISRKVATDV